MDDFVCQCEERFRSACIGLPFYGEYEDTRYCVLHLPSKKKEADFQEALRRKRKDRNFDFSRPLGVFWLGSPSLTSGRFLRLSTITRLFSECVIRQI